LSFASRSSIAPSLADQQRGQIEQTSGVLPKRRQNVGDQALDRLESNEPYEQKKYPLRAIIQQQARHLATFLRNERLEYTPFVATW
jgi:CRISPR-associated protein Cas1